MNTKLNSLPQQGIDSARRASTSPVMESLMRLGYAVRGLVYAVIGVLAFEVAIGVGGSLNDPQGAIATMGKTAIGTFLLYAILIGLIGYALWGVIRAVFDPLQKGNDLKGIVERVGYLISAVSYTLLALATYGLITGAASAARNGAQGAQTQQTAASILSKPWGPAAVAIAGLLVIGSGVIQIAQSLRADFGDQFQPYALNNEQRKWFIQSGRFGTAVRGLVFGLIGLFLFLAGFRHDPSQAQGIDGALAAILHQPFGPWLLGIVAVGLIAFGIYSAVSGAFLRLKR
ncbi:MAG: DUF1206 domain-containing protein [Chloroflexota bacterium]